MEAATENIELSEVRLPLFFIFWLILMTHGRKTDQIEYSRRHTFPHQPIRGSIYHTKTGQYCLLAPSCSFLLLLANGLQPTSVGQHV